MWSKLPPAKITNTVFENLDDDSVKIDIDDLEAHFANATAAPRAKAARAAKEEKEAAPTFMDPRRAQNVGIVLARIKQTPAEVKDALLKIDLKILTQETLRTLTKLVPTPEEEAIIHAFDADVSQCGKPEQFQAEVAKVPGVLEKVDLLVYKLGFEEAVKSLQPGVDAVLAACKELKDHKQLKEIMKMTLGLGNYMNGGGFRGGAYGFKIDTLKKLGDVKSTGETSITLFDYILEKLIAKDASYKTLNLGKTEEASRVSVQSLSTEAGQLRGQLKKVTDTINGYNEETDPSGAYRSSFAPFVTAAKSQLDAITESLKKMDEAATALVKFYGEDPKQMNIEEFFQLFVSVGSMWDGGVKASEKRKEEAKKPKKQLSKLNLLKPKGKPGAPGAPGGGDGKGVMDNVLEAMQSGNAFKTRRLRGSESK
eukprot:GFYU01003980.1.p1 GENE.GFYU01003980.1~~GFYU01003980.1.p1  ORF type:complete len:425 (+),score=183.05 GFYU01003980.1:2-1276(+)